MNISIEYYQHFVAQLLKHGVIDKRQSTSFRMRLACAVLRKEAIADILNPKLFQV